MKEQKMLPDRATEIVSDPDTTLSDFEYQSLKDSVLSIETILAPLRKSLDLHTAKRNQEESDCMLFTLCGMDLHGTDDCNETGCDGWIQKKVEE